MSSKVLKARSRDFCHPGIVGKKEGEKEGVEVLDIA
jgi:hypothetical protein